MSKSSIKTAVCLGIALLFGLSGSACAGKAQDNTTKEVTMSKLEKLHTPVFWAEGHPGKLDRETWQIQVTGLCKKPTTLSWKDLQKLPKTVANGRLTSVTRWSVNGNWGGVKLADIMKYVEAEPSVKYVRFWSVGMEYDTSIPVSIALMDKTLLAWSFDDEYLTEDFGGPVRAFVPYLWGYKSAKSVVKVELMDKYVPGYWETRGYTDDAEIEPGPCRDLNDNGKTKQIPGGEVTGFLD